MLFTGHVAQTATAGDGVLHMVPFVLSGDAELPVESEDVASHVRPLVRFQITAHTAPF